MLRNPGLNPATLLKKHAKAFKEIATLKNYEVNIHLNPSVKPVAKYPRMIPCHQHVAGHPRTIP